MYQGHFDIVRFALFWGLTLFVILFTIGLPWIVSKGFRSFHSAFLLTSMGFGISVEAEDGRIDYFCCSHVNHHFMALSRYLAWRGATILLLLIFFQKLVLKIILGIVQHLN